MSERETGGPLSTTPLLVTPTAPKHTLTFSKTLPYLVFAIIIALIITLSLFPPESIQPQPSPSISNTFIIDDSISDAIFNSMNTLLSSQSTSIQSLEAAVFVYDPHNQSWRVGNYSGNTKSDPLACVNLAYLVSAMRWCQEAGLSPNCLMASGPMASQASTIHSGIVVDMVTNSPNINVSILNTTFATWFNARHYTMNVLKLYGLLYNQTVMHKVYPTNSGLWPEFAEEIALTLAGPNLMSPISAGHLMLGIVTGVVEPQAFQFMNEKLSQVTFSHYTSLGAGLPPGTSLHTIVGQGPNTIAEIAHFTLPNGNQSIIAVFGHTQSGEEVPITGIQTRELQPKDLVYPDLTDLGMLAEYLIEDLSLDYGDPPKTKVDISNSGVKVFGSWEIGLSNSSFNESYLYRQGGIDASNANISWPMQISQTGLYEVCVWFVAGLGHSSNVTYIVTQDSTHIQTFYVNQQMGGGRWVLLGSFYLLSGQTYFVSVVDENGSKGVITADAIKYTMWPQLNSIPGATQPYTS